MLTMKKGRCKRSSLLEYQIIRRHHHALSIVHNITEVMDESLLTLFHQFVMRIAVVIAWDTALKPVPTWMTMDGSAGGDTRFAVVVG